MILLNGIKKSYIQLFFNLIYSRHIPDYPIILQILQLFANNEVQLSLVRIDVKSRSKNNKNNGNEVFGGGGPNVGNNNNSRFDVESKCKKCSKKYYPDCK